MADVRLASAVSKDPFALSPAFARLSAPERQDEPAFDEFVWAALLTVGFSHLSTTLRIEGPLLRVTLSAGPALAARQALAFDVLGQHFDVATDGLACLLVAPMGEFMVAGEEVAA